MELYANIKKRRKELGLTQSELARRVGYKDKTAIAHIEKGDIDLPQSKIVAFADALNTTPGDLLGEVEKEANPKVELIARKLEKLDDEALTAINNFIDLLN